MSAALRQLAAAATRAPSADNSQPWHLDWNGRELVVSHRTPAGVDPFGAGGHAVLLSVGHLVETSCEALRAMAGEFDVRWSERPESGTPYAAIGIGPLGDSVPRPDPQRTRHTNRFPYSDRALPVQSLREITADRERTARLVTVDDAQSRRGVAEVFNLCSQARFRTRELHEWLMASLRMTEEDAAAGDGLDLDTINLPPGGRSFMRLTRDWRVMHALNRVGIYKVLASADSSQLRQAPVLIAVVGHADPIEVLAAGRLLQRAWTALNGMGVAVHPYYAATDQYIRLQAKRVPDALRAQVAEGLARLRPRLEMAPDEMLHMILRVGWPTREPKRSRRLPLDMLFRDLTAPRND